MIKNEFSRIKAIRDLKSLWNEAIVLRDGLGYLLPIGECIFNNIDTMFALMEFRKDNQEAYPSRLHQITIESFNNWMRNAVIDKEDRILFQVLDPDGMLAGHIGFNNCKDGWMEIDNVVRGKKYAPRGIMSAAMDGLLAWAHNTFLCEQFYLRVFKTNTHAVEFYERLGWHTVKEIPLWSESNDVGTFYKDATTNGREPDAYFLRMEWTPTVEGRILTSGPSITGRETAYAADGALTLATDYTKYIRKLEQAFCDYLGVKYAIATSSCTGALHLALLASNDFPFGVTVPELTWCATASVASYTGTTLSCCDVCLESWTSLTTPDISVHLYGNPAYPKSGGIEDAAAALGATTYGRKCGTIGVAGCFSFQGAKLTSAGEGGMLVTNDRTLYERASMLANHGRDDSLGTFQIREVGYKYKMSNVQAAVALAQLERVDDFLEKKRKINQWYRDFLSDVPVTFQEELPGCKSSWWMTSILLPESIQRVSFMRELSNANVDTRPVFPPLSTLTPWKRPTKPNAAIIGARGVNLPSGVKLTRAQVEYVCRRIREVVCK